MTSLTSAGLLLDHFIPCKDYTTPLFIVLAIHIYLEDMFEKERMKNIYPEGTEEQKMAAENIGVHY